MATTGINVTPVSVSNVLNSGNFNNMANRVKNSGAGKMNWSKGLGAAASVAGMLTNTIGNAAQLAEVPENNFQETIDDINATSFNTNSYDSLYNQLNNFSFAKTDYTRDDMGGLSGGEAAGQIISNSLGSAMQGLSSFGPLGLLAGAGEAIAGGIGYAIGQGKKQREAQELNYNASVANQNKIAEIKNAAMDIGKNTRNTDWLNIAALGGPLDTTFTNGVRTITNGGSHENNPLGGVPQGIAQDGIPNLVEEGEVIYNDYVYSKRLKVPEADKEMLGLKSGKDYTYAEAAEQIQKESEERPNDPISKRNLNEMMGRLQGSQEALKEKRDGQALKRAVNKMTPDELAMFMQQLQQPQQMQPMMAMQGMQPMQPTQSEVPMFAKGGLLGHRFDWGGFSVDAAGNVVYTPVSDSDLSLNSDWGNIYAGLNDAQKAVVNPKIKAAIAANNTELMDPIFDPYVQQNRGRVVDGNIVYDIAKPYTGYDIGEEQEAARKAAQNLGATQQNTNNTVKGNPWAQALRTAPVFGALAGAIGSLFDKPNYSNIERAENAMRAVPRVGVGTVGQRLGYEPIDINYIAAQQANQALGARRALNEAGAGNPAGTQQAVIAGNYAGQTALADAIMKAGQLNRQNLAQALEFNRGTDTTNITNALQADLANQQRDEALAQFLYNTGQLRDAELARVQGNRSVQLTNAFNQLGNLGTDILNRGQAAAMANSLGVPYDIFMESLKKTSGFACGGKMKTKKGGKHA